MRRVVASVAAATAVGVIVTAAALWQRRSKIRGALLIRSSSLGEALYFADIAKLHLPQNVSIRTEVCPSTESATEFSLELANEVIRIGMIPCPDTRVYRTIPQFMLRAVAAHVCDPPMESRVLEMEEEVHEAAFECVMREPWNAASKEVASKIPFEVYWCEDRPRVVAECFLVDVVGARHDPLLCGLRVVDVVCARAVEHHGGDWTSLINNVHGTFGVQLRSSSVEELAEELLFHRNLFSSAMLTATGANKLEMVFGTSATHFPLLQCSSESVEFVAELYRAAVEGFGKWTYDNFVRYMHAVFAYDRPEIVRHVPRIFRTLNKSRTGEISFDELCAWIARKLSTRTTRHPEQHLLATVMSLRLPLALFIDKQPLWPKLQCTLRSLSDDECHV